MRIVFMGTPNFSVPPLEKILDAKHDVVAVYCQPPRPAGRGMAERKSPVHEFASARGLRVLTPENLQDKAVQQEFAAHDCDAAVVVAYGLILPPQILNAPRFGCFNLHASKLPRWRGAAPIQRAIMAGDVETAAMVMRMDKGLDTGPTMKVLNVEIPAEMTAGELHDDLSVKGGDLMVEALEAVDRGKARLSDQALDGVTYAEKIQKAEAKIDFNREALGVHNLIRGLSPFPGAWFDAVRSGKSERIKVLRSSLVTDIGAPGEVLRADDELIIACGAGAIRLEMVQRAGKQPVTAGEFLRGFGLETGTIIS